MQNIDLFFVVGRPLEERNCLMYLQPDFRPTPTKNKIVNRHEPYMSGK